VRSATPGEAPITRASTVTSSALANTGTSVSISTRNQCSSTNSQSSFMPMVMKNSPSKTSWKGRISVSTRCLYSVSAISMPARNAPSAIDNPACSVSQDKPSVMSKRFSMNSSSLLRRATTVSQLRITRGPPQSNAPTSTPPLSMATPNVINRSASAGADNAGISTNKGTTAKS